MPRRAGFLIFAPAAHFIVTGLKKEGIITCFFKPFFSEDICGRTNY
jgi:hypothetical protein